MYLSIYEDMTMVQKEEYTDQDVEDVQNGILDIIKVPSDGLFYQLQDKNIFIPILEEEE